MPLSFARRLKTATAMALPALAAMSHVSVAADFCQADIHYVEQAIRDYIREAYSSNRQGLASACVDGYWHFAVFEKEKGALALYSFTTNEGRLSLPDHPQRFTVTFQTVGELVKKTPESRMPEGVSKEMMRALAASSPNAAEIFQSAAGNINVLEWISPEKMILKIEAKSVSGIAQFSIDGPVGRPWTMLLEFNPASARIDDIVPVTPGVTVSEKE